MANEGAAAAAAAAADAASRPPSACACRAALMEASAGGSDRRQSQTSAVRQARRHRFMQRDRRLPTPPQAYTSRDGVLLCSAAALPLLAYCPVAPANSQSSERFANQETSKSTSLDTECDAVGAVRARKRRCFATTLCGSADRGGGTSVIGQVHCLWVELRCCCDCRAEFPLASAKRPMALHHCTTVCAIQPRLSLENAAFCLYFPVVPCGIAEDLSAQWWLK